MQMVKNIVLDKKLDHLELLDLKNKFFWTKEWDIIKVSNG